MSFAPVIPVGGIGGWAFLNRTLAAQKAAAQASPEAKRDEAYFREKIGSIKTAEQLVSDRRLLKVALGAYGLDGDLNNRFFIRKVLEEGTKSGEGLANKLADKSYEKLSAAFGFGDLETPRTSLSGFADEILARHAEVQFETAVGEQNQDMRLALHARRELEQLAAEGASESTKWYRILGSSPLRSVFQTAFGLPTAFASIDLDQQVSTLKDKVEAAYGDDTVTQFSDGARLESFLQRFLARSSTATSSTTSSGSAALAILQRGVQGGSLLDLL